MMTPPERATVGGHDAEQPRSSTNVYYLPAPAAETVTAPAEEPVRLVRRLRNAWWRLRLAVTEIRAILRQPRPRYTLDDYAAILELEDEGRVRARARRGGRPAQVIDFEAARARLRPVPQA